MQISVDNDTSPSYTMLTLRCEDRKGLLYDIFRTMKEIDLRCGGRVLGRGQGGKVMGRRGAVAERRAWGA